MAINKQWQETHRSWIKQVGLSVVFERITGVAPNAIVIPVGGASVTAIVRDYKPNGIASSEAGYRAGQPGALPQGEREILVMADELAAAGFPVPLRKNDRITVALTGEILTLSRVDQTKRLIANCYEAYASGVI